MPGNTPGRSRGGTNERLSLAQGDPAGADLLYLITSCSLGTSPFGEELP
jgi:hypothetical protein